MFFPARLGNGEHARMAGQEVQNHLPGRCAVLSSNGLQHPPASAVRRGEGGMAEGAVSHHGDLLLGTVGEKPVLDAPVPQVVEHLVAGQSFMAKRSLGLFQFLQVQVADSDESDTAPLDQGFHGPHGLPDRVTAAPVEQVQVQSIRSKSIQASLAGPQGAVVGGIVGKHLAHQKDFVPSGADGFRRQLPRPGRYRTSRRYRCESAPGRAPVAGPPPPAVPGPGCLRSSRSPAR